MSDLSLPPRGVGLAHHRRVFAGFFLYAFALAGFYSRVAEVQAGLGISKSVLGLALLGAPAGTQLTLVLGSRLVERLGQRDTVLLALPVLAAFAVAAALAPSAPGLGLALFGAGLAIGALEIVLNLEADRAEHALGRRVMNRAHAFWSLGFFASGLVGAAAAQAGLAPAWHLAGAGALACLLMWALYGPIAPAPARGQQGAAQGEAGAGAGAGAGKAPRFVLPTPAILLLVVVTLPAMLLEGASIDWSVIYMTETFTLPALLNGLAFVAAAGFQGLARYLGDPVVDRHGPVAVSRVLLVLLGLGCLMVTLAPLPWVALVGFALIGVGSSSLFPLAMSAAAQRRDRSPALNVAALAQLSFITFLLAPPLLGFVAQHLGIRLAFGVALPLVLLALVHVRRLDPAQPD